MTIDWRVGTLATRSRPPLGHSTRRWRLQRNVDDVPGLDVEIMREGNAEVGDLQAIEIDHDRNDIVRGKQLLAVSS